MPLTREQKEQIVEELKQKIDKQKSITFINFKGLGVKDFTDLRKQLEEIGAEAKVAKKTLVNLAFEKSGIEMKDYQGQLALVFGYEDKLRPFKVIYEKSEETDLDIIGGYLDQEFIGKEEVERIAQLPSREELLGKFTRATAGPLSNLVNVLQGNIKGLVYALNAIQAEKRG